jgi:D-alanyl-D-alanine carboxypeptidase
MISKNLKFFFAGFLFSLPIFWGTNIFQKNLEDFLFWEKVAKEPELLTAQIVQEEKLEQLKPIRNRQVANLEISAGAAISVFIDSQGNRRVLFTKESGRILPIASLTKLMTANVIMENYSLSQEGDEDKSSSSSIANALLIKVSEKAIAKEEETGFFKVGEIFSAEGLLYSSLIESSNDATAALTELIGENAFVDLMNLTAGNLQMRNTHFVDAIGLDPDEPDGQINFSTAEDLVKLTAFLLKNRLEVLKISSLPEYNLYTANGVFHHKIKNTNELLVEIPDVVGGKTGWTPQAQGCLLLVIEAPKNQGKIINVILDSSDRFGEMKKIVDWLKEAYKW